MCKKIGCRCPAPRDSPPFSEAQLKGIFRRCDRNRDGQLSRNELKAAFSELGAHVPGWRAMRALQRADRNGDGCISDEELDQLVKYALKFGYVVH